MKLFFAILTFCSLGAGAQTAEDSVRQTIKNMFDGMRSSDSTLLKSAFAPGSVLQSVDSRKADVRVITESISDFIASVSKPHDKVYDERITFDLVRVDGDLAIAWTPYKFYIGDQFSHCGVNLFQLVRLAGIWKIQYIIDTRRRADCP
jgi:hypothetical protein